MYITNYLVVLVRYLIVPRMGASASRNWVSSDQNAILSQNAEIIVCAIVGLGTIAYALFKRPSSKAMDAKTAINAQLPKQAPVVIQTRGCVPDIIVLLRRHD